ncbi:MAG: hypothetical protein KA015_02655 [Spirochaetes bacterium]|nr:hypothetical protein [Spirochaetota bacterium]
MKVFVRVFLSLSILILLINIPILYVMTYDYFISVRADFYAPYSIKFDETKRESTNAFPTYYGEEIVFEGEKYYLTWPFFYNICGHRRGNDELMGKYLIVFRTESETDTLIKKIDIDLGIEEKYQIFTIEKDELSEIEITDSKQFYVNKSRLLYFVFKDFEKQLDGKNVKMNIVIERNNRTYVINKIEKVKHYESVTKYD